MIDKINENDLLTLDDDSKYFILSTVDNFNGKYHLIIGYLEDEEKFDLDDITFVKEVDENGDIYLDPVENENMIQKLSSYIISYHLLENVPGLDDELLADIEERINN